MLGRWGEAAAAEFLRRKGYRLLGLNYRTRRGEIDVIASGGMSSMEDLEQLCAAGIRGAIIGKALYEGRIDLSLAVRRFQA